METITQVVGTKNINGTPINIVRNYFVYESINYLKLAQSHFSKEEKRLAKQIHKYENKK